MPAAKPPAMEEGWSGPLRAAALGDAAAMRHLLQWEPALASQRLVFGGQTLLHAAVGCCKVRHLLQGLGGEGKALPGAIAQRLEVVGLLLRAAPGAALVADDAGQLPLHIAAVGACREVVQLLLQAAPAAASARDNRGRLPLHASAARGSRGVVQLLLAASGDAAITEPDSLGQTALDIAVESNNAAAAAVLLRAAAPSISASGLGAAGSPLLAHAAVAKGQRRVLKLLVKAYPAGVASVDGMGSTALSYAVQSDTLALPLLRLLIHLAPWPCKAAAFVGDMEGKLPLGYVLDRMWGPWGDHMAELLLELAPGTAGLPLNSEGLTAVSWAASKASVSVLRRSLAAAPAAASLPGNFARTPLHLAAESGKLADSAACVKILLAAAPGATMAEQLDGRLPLHLAAMRGNQGAVRLLLEAAPEAAGAVDHHGGSALAWAAEHGSNPAVVSVLLEASPPFVIKMLDGDLDSPLACAALGGCPESIELLMRACPEMAMVRNGAGHLPLEQLLVREVGKWPRKSFYRNGYPYRTASERVRAARCLLAVGDPAVLLEVLSRAEPELSLPLLPEVVRRWRLAPAQWALVPGWCPSLAEALPAVLGRQDAEGAGQLVRRLRDGERARLRFAALCLRRAQHEAGVVLPPALAWGILAQALLPP